MIEMLFDPSFDGSNGALEDFSGLTRGAVFFKDEPEGSSTLTVDERFGHGSGVGFDASDMERLTQHLTPDPRSRKKCGRWNPYLQKPLNSPLSGSGLPMPV